MSVRQLMTLFYEMHFYITVIIKIIYGIDKQKLGQINSIDSISIHSEIDLSKEIFVLAIFW